MRRFKYLILISLCLAGAIDAGAEEAISLALPIKCQPGVSCFFQNYVDPVSYTHLTLPTNREV